MSQFARNNHYIPQFYLRQWANQEQKVWEYKLLVSHDNVPCWQLVSLKDSTAWQRDLYTGFVKDNETDEVEHWYDYEIENPAQITFEKISNNEKLNKLDVSRLIRFVAAQYVRTPAAYFRSKLVFENTVHKTIKKDSSELTIGSANYLTKPASTNEFNKFSKWFPFEINIGEPSEENNMVKVEFTTGFTRNMWHFQNYTLLDRTYSCLLEHDWHVVSAPPGVRLNTSDDPVVFANFYDEGKYDFKGGWGRKNGNAFFPISPYHFLFTQMGDGVDEKYVKDNIFLLTYWMQRITIENAFRRIYSVSQNNSVISCRKRMVSELDYKNEREIWANWNRIQNDFEQTFKQ